MTGKLLNEQHLEFLTLTGGCTGWSKSIHVKMPHCWKSHGPQREKTCLGGFANNTGADQPAHPCSLIRTFVILLLESTIFNLATGKISIF